MPYFLNEIMRHTRDGRRQGEGAGPVFSSLSEGSLVGGESTTLLTLYVRGVARALGAHATGVVAC